MHLSGRTKGLPEHVGIIMDGNGRWARRRALPRTFGQQEGGKALKRAGRYAAQRGISILTVYAFSTENWTRPRAEVECRLARMHTTCVMAIEPVPEEGVRAV